MTIGIRNNACDESGGVGGEIFRIDFGGAVGVWLGGSEGFGEEPIQIEVGDSIRFLNTDMRANGNLEPHCISDPESIAATEESCWIIDNGEPSRTWNSGELNFGNTGTDKFFDR